MTLAIVDRMAPSRCKKIPALKLSLLMLKRPCEARPFIFVACGCYNLTILNCRSEHLTQPAYTIHEFIVTGRY